MQKNILNNRSGFSLIELMIVVAIIGVLAAVGVPQYQNYIKSAQGAVAKTQLSSIASGEGTFYAANNEYTAWVVPFTTGGATGSSFVPLSASNTSAFAVGFTACSGSAPSYYCKDMAGNNPPALATALDVTFSRGAKAGAADTPNTPNMTATTFTAQAVSTKANTSGGTTCAVNIDQTGKIAIDTTNKYCSFQ